MTKLEAIAASKQFRKDADELLQRMKHHCRSLKKINSKEIFRPERQRLGLPMPSDLSEDLNEVIAQHILSIRDLESSIMRQGMALKYIGNPDPYPESRDPSSPKVEPTSDGLKM